MPPRPTGTIETHRLADGSRAFRLRFRVNGRRHRVVLHEEPGCECGCGGGWDQRGARNELGNILARVRAGVWEPPRPRGAGKAGVDSETPTFGSYAEWWMEAKRAGLLGAKPIAQNTIDDYRWRLSHLVPVFSRYRLDEIDRELCLYFKSRKLQEAAELQEAIDAGAEIRDDRQRRVVPLGPSSLRKLIACLASILDEAVEDGHIDQNPARSMRMRVRVPKPKAGLPRDGRARRGA
jgi:hypothetical protein